MSRIPLIVDADTAQDDAFALMIALRHERADLLAVTVNCGNVDFDQMVENTLYTIEVAGRGGEVPVYPGARRPLMQPVDHAKYVHGGDGFGDAGFPPAGQRAEAEHAAHALVRLVDAHPGELTIVAQAPLTNIALATALDRSLPRKVRRLVIMGGTSNGVGNITAAAEANFRNDPEAASIVLEAGYDLTLVPWSLTLSHGILDGDQLAGIARLGTPRSRFFEQANCGTLRYCREVVGLPGSTHPDSLAVAIALEPEIVTRADEHYVAVETAGTYARGYCMVDAVRRSGRPPNARVVEAVDRERFHEVMREALA